MRNNLDHARQWSDDKLTDLERLCRKMCLNAEFLFGGAEGEGFEGAAHNWRCTLTYKGRAYACDFFGGAVKAHRYDVVDDRRRHRTLQN